MSDSNGTAPVAQVAEIPDLPDFLGTAARVDSVAELLQHAQGQRLRLEGMRTLNGQTLDDPVAAQTDDGTEAPTYRERFAQLEAGVAALWEENEDIREELIAEAVKRRRRIEQRLESGAV